MDKHRVGDMSRANGEQTKRPFPLADHPADVLLEKVEKALAVLRVPPTPGEYDLHRLVAEALKAADLHYRHEVALGPRCRIDFLVGNVGIEIKKGHVNARRLRAQAEKYLAFEEVGALMLVTMGRADVPGAMMGKKVRVFGLNRLWGVSLP